jgi:hypothetical protein
MSLGQNSISTETLIPVSQITISYMLIFTAPRTTDLIQARMIWEIGFLLMYSEDRNLTYEKTVSTIFFLTYSLEDWPSLLVFSDNVSVV